VDDARDGSYRRHCFSQLHLAAKSSHMGVDANRLAYRLHRPTTYGCQTRVQGPLTDSVLFHLVAKLLLMVLLPNRAHTLRLSDKGIESLVRCCLVQSPAWGSAGFKPSLLDDERPFGLGTLH
jgi:hypothetical protein